MNVQEDHRFQ